MLLFPHITPCAGPACEGPGSGLTSGDFFTTTTGDRGPDVFDLAGPTSRLARHLLTTVLTARPSRTLTSPTTPRPTPSCSPRPPAPTSAPRSDHRETAHPRHQWPAGPTHPRIRRIPVTLLPNGWKWSHAWYRVPFRLPQAEKAHSGRALRPPAGRGRAALPALPTGGPGARPEDHRHHRGPQAPPTQRTWRPPASGVRLPVPGVSGMVTRLHHLRVWVPVVDSGRRGHRRGDTRAVPPPA